jgi:hypothetical protein
VEVQYLNGRNLFVIPQFLTPEECQAFYDPGQRFAPHMECSFQRDNGEQSQFTFLVYLNDNFEGGATAFHESRASLRVTPEQGKALVFSHRQLHEGMPVMRGRKYILRTDVMYRHQAR